MFGYTVTLRPLGLLYGSAGAFLSPENLVGRSGAKFPPEAATLSGIYFNQARRQPDFYQELKNHLQLAGPFWAEVEEPDNFYVPIPRNRVLGKEATDQWSLRQMRWSRDNPALQPDYRWQRLAHWQSKLAVIRERAAGNPWKFVPVLHPHLKDDERHVLAEDGLFLEQAVQMQEGTALVYLASHALKPGWYRFGGESHLVEVDCRPVSGRLAELLQRKIGRAFALLTPGVWGSNRLSYRYPRHADFPEPTHLLTDKPVPYRYRLGEKLSRGRYAVPAGSVYVLPRALGLTWSEWPEEWFPKEGYSLKRWGCGLALPIDIDGLETERGAA
ncbi:type III-B CRISPR module-associated Cmr3 family protein [Gloeobacter morelensis]|uniref:CRISPR-associated protein n=1 Tax=Gloeobacter morelensis MG652769 TaxID=2781736 RepID=A0ABY3PIW0_9CYAN|nr:type III-B CRISPR module-associated Cmr3 family protein [Gloeobacter morelensis]UFP93587.1 CRISPR-associated protein [Gloeobacter morelensis MG652769]